LLGKKGQLLGPGHEDCIGLPKKERKERKRKEIEDEGVRNTGKKKWYQTFVSLVEKENDVRAALAMFGLRRCYNNIHAVHVYPLCSPTPENASKSLKISSYQSFILPFIVIL
jgi:hypothetical protein